MKKIFWIFLTLLIFGCRNTKQNPTGDQHQNHNMKVVTSTSKTLSPEKYAMAIVGDAHIHIEYSAPSVRGRII